MEEFMSLHFLPSKGLLVDINALTSFDLFHTEACSEYELFSALSAGKVWDVSACLLIIY